MSPLPTGMIPILPLQQANCQTVSRRELLQLGGASAVGLTLSGAARSHAAGAGRPVNCIFLFLWGGPSQFETFDPKPDAPSEVRGPFGSLPTRVDGLRFGEHLPRLAGMADRFTTIRCMHHENSLHPQSGSYAQAGQHPVAGKRFPNHGAVVARFGARGRSALPPYVRVGPELWDSAGDVSAQDGGFLGGSYAPFAIDDPREPVSRIAALAPLPGAGPERLDRRRTLRADIEGFQRAIESADTLTYDASFQKAFSLLTSADAKSALDLSREPAAVRERYGNTLPGQGLLAARRLVESGVRFVQVNWCRVVIQQGWDTHGTGTGGGIASMRDFLLPTLDRAVSALFEDLEQRGLHRETVVVVGGEFGRTHRLNAKGGRDHWPGVYSTLLYGHGVPRGFVVGESDANGMYPDGPYCSPEDLSLTLYRLLGLDVASALRDAGIVRAAAGIPGVG